MHGENPWPGVTFFADGAAHHPGYHRFFANGAAPMPALEQKLAAMGHTLPAPFKFPNPNRTGCVVVGAVIFVSGHGP
jgi:hypothetical protein